MLVAVITGGTSGMGLDVAETLNKTNQWKIHILGSNSHRGEEAAAPLHNTTYHQVDVTNYDQQAATFDAIFAQEKRLDFVFANAGIAEDTTTFFAKHEGIPPRPNIGGVIDINFTGAIHTSYLAMHYFRRSPEETKGKRNLIIMSSIGGLYPCVHTSTYSAGKHGLVGFTRSIGGKLWSEGVRVNAVCPGVVITPLMTPELRAFFDESTLIQMGHVTDVMMKLISGDEVTDSRGVSVSSEELHSRAVLISREKFHFVEMPEYFDDETALTHHGMMN